MKKIDKRFIGSNAALILGVVALLGGLGQGDSSLSSAGIFMILGALAYRSAKKRKLGITQPSTVKLVSELIAIAIVIILVLLTNRDILVNDPFPSLVIPIWAVIAYVVISARKTPIKNA